MMQELIYYKDQYKTEIEAKIVKVDENRVLLDKTIFIPQTNTELGDFGKIQDIKIAGSKKEGHEIPDETIKKAIAEANTDIKSGVGIKTYEDEKRKGFRWCAVKDYPPIPCGGLHIKNTKEIREIVLVNKEIKQGNQKITIIVK